MPIVALANHGSGQRVQKPSPQAAGGFVEETGILFQKRGQDGAADEYAGNGVGIAGTIALGVAFGALAISVEVVLRLLNSSRGSDNHESDGIHARFPGKLEFLPRGARNRIGDVADI